MKPIPTKNTFCTDIDGLNETCDVIKKSTKYDDIESLQCTLCVNEWAHNEPKYECIHCEQIYCRCVVGQYQQKMDRNDSNITLNESDDEYTKSPSPPYTPRLDNNDDNDISNDDEISINQCSSSIKLRKNDRKRRFDEIKLNIAENKDDIQPNKRRKLNNESIVFGEDNIDKNKEENEILNDDELSINNDANIKLNGCSSSIKCSSSTNVYHQYTKSPIPPYTSLENEENDINDELNGCSPSIDLISTKHEITLDTDDKTNDDINNISVISGEDKMDKTKDEYIEYLENENKKLLAESKRQRVIINRKMIDDKEEESQNVVADINDIDDNYVCVFEANSWKRYYNDKDGKYYWFNQKTGKSH